MSDKAIEVLSKEEWLDRVNFPNKVRKVIEVEPVKKAEPKKAKKKA